MNSIWMHSRRSDVSRRGSRATTGERHWQIVQKCYKQLILRKQTNRAFILRNHMLINYAFDSHANANKRWLHGNNDITANRGNERIVRCMDRDKPNHANECNDSRMRGEPNDAPKSDTSSHHSIYYRAEAIFIQINAGLRARK